VVAVFFIFCENSLPSVDRRGGCFFIFSENSLPSVRQKALGKDGFADDFFTKWLLPSVTLGKGFAECNWGFAECLVHSAKKPNPVVIWVVSPTFGCSKFCFHSNNTIKMKALKSILADNDMRDPLVIDSNICSPHPPHTEAGRKRDERSRANAAGKGTGRWMSARALEQRQATHQSNTAADLPTFVGVGSCACSCVLADLPTTSEKGRLSRRGKL
jgi:hypothetical protein